MGCSICFETFGADDEPAHRPVSLVPCGHIFHHGCVLQMLKSGSARSATRADVVEHRRAVFQRHRHQLHSERIRLAVTGDERDPEEQRQQAAQPAHAGLSRPARVTLTANQHLDMVQEMQAHMEEGIIPQYTAVVICPLCKTVCPIHNILDLWPSEHDDLNWFENFIKRDSSGPSGTLTNAASVIQYQAIFEDLAEFRQFLSAYVMYTRNVEVRLMKDTGNQVLRMFERLVPSEVIQDQLKQAMGALAVATERFGCIALQHRHKCEMIAMREAELKDLKKVLDEKDGKLTRLSTQLARDQAAVKATSIRIAKEKIEFVQKTSEFAKRAEELEASEREAKQRESQTKVALAQGLAQRDEQCKAKVEAAEARALKAEKEREEAEKEKRQALDRQADVGEKLRMLMNDNKNRKMENETLKKDKEALKKMLDKREAASDRRQVPAPAPPLIVPRGEAAPRPAAATRTILLGKPSTRTRIGCSTHRISIAGSAPSASSTATDDASESSSAQLNMPYDLQKAREQGSPTRDSQISPTHRKGSERVGLYDIAARSAGSRSDAAGPSSSRIRNDGWTRSRCVIRIPDGGDNGDMHIAGNPTRVPEGGNNNGDMRPPPFYPRALPQPDSRSARAMKSSSSAARFVPPRSSTPERAPPSGLNAGSPIFVDSSIESIPMVLDEPDVPPRSSSPFKVPGSSRNAWQRTGSSNNVLGSSSSVNVDPGSKVNSLAVGNGKGKRKEEYAPGTARTSTTGGRHLESMLNGCAREPTMLSSSPPPADANADAQRQQLPSSTSTYVLKAAMLKGRSRRSSDRRSRGNETMDSSLDVGPEDLSLEADEDFPMWGMGAIGAGTKRNRRG